ncbi:hypothetical protein BT63DRAFT_456712 [Microthyrium microscopicum]|uniref:Uncharacterized protein n=1 Tax=Microthyrium microscopicum TaxID=703497 RepID=A0A6A6U5I9_9PEZI|nr:hypothetical protein BT63DRAFT_456712 [Microthyrium microscopicum]
MGEVYKTRDGRTVTIPAFDSRFTNLRPQPYQSTVGSRALENKRQIHEQLQSPLFRLPLELREIIYCSGLSDNNPNVGFYTMVLVWHPRSVERSQNLTEYRYLEAIPWLYSRNTFAFRQGFLFCDFMLTLKSTSADSITSLSISTATRGSSNDLFPYERTTWEDMCTLVTTLPKLRHFRLDVQLPDWGQYIQNFRRRFQLLLGMRPLGSFQSRLTPVNYEGPQRRLELGDYGVVAWPVSRAFRTFAEFIQQCPFELYTSKIRTPRKGQWIHFQTKRDWPKGCVTLDPVPDYFQLDLDNILPSNQRICPFERRHPGLDREFDAMQHLLVSVLNSDNSHIDLRLG